MSRTDKGDAKVDQAISAVPADMRSYITNQNSLFWQQRKSAALPTQHRWLYLEYGTD